MQNYKVDTLGHRIKKARVRQGYTQEQLADIMHIPKSTISAYENDKVDIKGSIIVELAKTLTTTPNYLLGMDLTDDDSFIHLLNKINDSKVREMIIVQLEALAEKYS